jgi:flavodoxin
VFGHPASFADDTRREDVIVRSPAAGGNGNRISGRPSIDPDLRLCFFAHDPGGGRSSVDATGTYFARKEKTMKTLIVCESHAYGNTRRVAETIAAVLGAEVVAPRDAQPAEVADYDLVGFGSGIYAMNFYAELRRFVQALQTVDGKRAFVFLTSASSERSMRKPTAKLAAKLTDRGYEVVGQFWCRGFWNPWLLRPIGGVNRGHPTRVDLDDAGAFARGLVPAVSPGPADPPVRARALVRP